MMDRERTGKKEMGESRTEEKTADLGAKKRRKDIRWFYEIYVN